MIYQITASTTEKVIFQNRQNVIFSALHIIAMANGNISKLARNAKVERRSIYNIFKKGSYPTFKTFRLFYKT